MLLLRYMKKEKTKKDKSQHEAAFEEDIGFGATTVESKSREYHGMERGKNKGGGLSEDRYL